MAHPREEIALGVVRAVGFFFRFLKGFLAGFPHGNVFDHEQEMFRFALLVSDNAGGAADPKHFAILVHVTLVSRVAGRSVQQALGELAPGLDVVRESNVLGRALPQLFIGITDHFAERRVDAQEPLVECEQRHADRRALKEFAKNRVVRRQLYWIAKVG